MSTAARAPAVSGRSWAKPRLSRPRLSSRRTGRSAVAPAACSSSDSARTTFMTRSKISGGALSCGAALSRACETKPSSATFSAHSTQSVT